MSYADKLEEIQRRRAELRALERLAESEAKAMTPWRLSHVRTHCIEVLAGFLPLLPSHTRGRRPTSGAWPMGCGSTARDGRGQMFL
jgi:hypothetical protein